MSALAWLAVNQPDVIILDMLLPGAPGMDVLDYIYAAPHLADTHVIVMTAHERFRDLTLRPDDLVLIKPTDMRVVRETVRALLPP